MECDNIGNVTKPLGITFPTNKKHCLSKTRSTQTTSIRSIICTMFMKEWSKHIEQTH